MDHNPKPVDIAFNQSTRVLEIKFDDGLISQMSAEYLRVHSPSAQVKGHGVGQEVLQVEKSQVNISDIEPAGNYAIKLIFDDDHDTGFYTWGYLYDLAVNQDQHWHDYLERLSREGASR